MKSKDTDVIIIGRWLGWAYRCQSIKSSEENGRVFEASDRVGGRVKTDNTGGFLLDHGFQVLLTAYPEAKQLLDYKALELCRFSPGALILTGNGSAEVGDPIWVLATQSVLYYLRSVPLQIN